MPLDDIGAFIVVLALDVQIEICLETFDDANFASPIDLPSLVEPIVGVPNADLDSFISLRSGHVHEFVGLSAANIATSVQLFVFGDFPELEGIAICHRGIDLDDNTMVLDSQKIVAFLGLTNPNVTRTGSIKSPILPLLISRTLLQSAVTAISSQNHIWKAQNDLVAIFVFVFNNPHLVGVVFVDGTQFKRVFSIVSHIGGFKGQSTLLMNQYICVSGVYLVAPLIHRHFHQLYLKICMQHTPPSYKNHQESFQWYTLPLWPAPTSPPLEWMSIALKGLSKTSKTLLGCFFMMSYTQSFPSADPVNIFASSSLKQHLMLQLWTWWPVYSMTLFPVPLSTRYMELLRADTTYALPLFAMAIAWTASLISSQMNWPVRTSQNLVVPSIEQQTISYPSSISAWVTESLKPLMVSIGWKELARLSQNFTVVSYDALTIRLFSQLNRTELTRLLWPANLRIDLLSITSVTITFLSPPQVTNFELSFEISSPHTSQLCKFLQCLIIRFLAGLYRHTLRSSDPVIQYSPSLLNFVMYIGPVWTFLSSVWLFWVGSLEPCIRNIIIE